MGSIDNLHQLRKEETTAVLHHQDEVILLTFWATWCGPSQKPMAENQEMLEKHMRSGDWDGVRFVGICLDKEAMPQTLVKRVDQRHWTSMEHYWTTDDSLAKVFGFEITPHCVLVDKTGTIVWQGHPATRRIEEDVSALLEGEEIDLKREDSSEEADAATF